MKKYLTILIALCSVHLVFGQKVKTVAPEKVCDQNSQAIYFEVEDVEAFKDSLTLKLDIATVTNGKDVDSKGFKYSTKIKDESPIVQISKKVAFRISIARVVENGKKYYLYTIHLYRKEGKCWDDLYPNSSWDKCSLGSITNGYGIGNQGSSNYVGFSGDIILK